MALISFLQKPLTTRGWTRFYRRDYGLRVMMQTTYFDIMKGRV